LTAPLIRLQAVHKRFRDGTQALAGVDIAVAAGEFVALLGPSGCGKSTVLRLAAGLDDPSDGTVQAPARQARREAGPDAGTAFVFQEPTLMPWATVAANVALPLRLAGVPAAEAAPRVAAVLARVGLADFAQTKPAALSGGMKMRASIARALVTRPQVLLMDEPFAALDDITRQRLNDDLLAWWQAQGMAALFVTHSVAEAVFLSQRVLVMAARPGRVVAELAIDAPYPRPTDFRHSPGFAAACRSLSQALQQAFHTTGPAAAGAPP
jgi:NitT/TauT family transport system ATP-binding protein